MSSGSLLRSDRLFGLPYRIRSARPHPGAGWVALVVLAVFLAGCANDEEKVAEFLSRGEAYVEDSKDKEAIIEYKNVLQLDPENGDAHEQLSLAYLRVNKPREAYWEMSETVRVAPENVEARLRYGTISAAIGDYDLSNEQAEAVLRIESNNARGHTLRAQAREARDDLEGAESDFRAAVAAEPDAAAFRFLLAGFLERYNQGAEAESVYRALLDLEPSYLVAHTLARLVLRAGNRNDEADVLLERLIELANTAPIERPTADGDNEGPGTTTLLYNVLREEAIIGAYTLKSLAQRSRGDGAAAIATLEEGVSRSEGKIQLIYQMAQFYRADGLSEEEQKMIRRATDEAPGNADAQLVLSAYLGTQGDLDGALAAAQEAAAANEDSVPARLRVAELLIDLGFRNDDADTIERGRGIVDAVLADTPDAPEANFVKAKLELGENDLPAAKSSLETTLQARPEWGQARYILGATLAASAELARARVELEAALESEPGLLKARKLLIQVYQSLGEHEFVIENGRTYLQSRPDDMPVRIAVGQSLIRVGRSQEAYEEIATVPEDQWDAPAFFALGRIDLAYGRVEEGARKLERADVLAPGNPQVIRTLIMVDRNAGNDEKALERARVAAEASPENTELAELLGEALVTGGDLDAGRAALRRAIEIEPRNVSAQITLAELASRLGDPAGAVTTLEAAASSLPESADIQYRLAQAYDRLGQTDDALAAYEKTISLNPEMPLAKNNLAYLLAEHGGDLDRALELAQQAKEAMPDDGNAADTLGWVLLKRGLPSAAIGYLEEAADRFPSEAFEVQGIVHNHLAQAYEKSQNKGKAIATSRVSIEFYERLVKASAERGLTPSEPAWLEEAKSRIARLESAG